MDLTRPRDQVATRELPEFTSLRGQVFRLIRQDRYESETTEVTA